MGEGKRYGVKIIIIIIIIIVIVIYNTYCKALVEGKRCGTKIIIIIIIIIIIVIVIYKTYQERTKQKIKIIIYI